MRVLLLPADEVGCGHYRMLYPARALQGTGEPVEITIDDKLPITKDLTPLSRVRKVGEVDADVIVMQRPLKYELATAIPMFQRKGITVVVDIDDDFVHLHPDHAVWARYHPKYSPRENFKWLQAACGAADLVTTSTKALAERFGSHGRVAVLPNCIPAEWLQTGWTAHEGVPVVGWSGFVSAHPGDLQVTQGGAQDALDRTGARWLTIGDGQGVQQALGLKDEVSATGPVEFDKFRFELSKLDVGIVPLHDSVFNAAKSWLKGLEYAALGIPFVASPRAEYSRLANRGVGLLAHDKRKHWTRAIEQLLDPDVAEPLVNAGLVWARDQTYEQHGWRWAEAWAAAWSGRTGRGRGAPRAGAGRP